MERRNLERLIRGTADLHCPVMAIVIELVRFCRGMRRCIIVINNLKLINIILYYSQMFQRTQLPRGSKRQGDE